MTPYFDIKALKVQQPTGGARKKYSIFVLFQWFSLNKSAGLFFPTLRGDPLDPNPLRTRRVGKNLMSWYIRTSLVLVMEFRQAQFQLEVQSPILKAQTSKLEGQRLEAILGKLVKLRKPSERF